MERSRLKTVVLALLACINLLLLGYLLLSQYLRYRIPAKAREEVAVLLESRGIALSDKALPRFDRTMDSLHYAEDEAKQNSIAKALLGDGAQYSDQGGGKTLYESPQGQAVFRRGRRLDVTLPAQDVPASSADTEQAALTLLRKAGIAPGKYAAVFGKLGDGVFIRFYPKIRGFEVENAALEVQFWPDRTVVTGCYLTGRPQTVPFRTQGFVSLLAGFSTLTRQYSLEVKEITRVSYVYYYDEGRAVLIPACRIETDSRTLLLDAGDGSLLLTP